MKPIVSKKCAIITSAVLILLAIAAALIIPTALGKTNLEKQLDLGRLCLVELDYEGAILAFERAIEIDPNNADAYIGLAEAYLALGRETDARTILDEGLLKTGNDALTRKLAELFPAETETDTEAVTETEPLHIHTYADTWNTSEAEHWLECECGDKTDIAEHSYGEWITTTEATEDAEGSKTRSCDICGYEETELIPMLEHIHVYGEWESDTVSHWQECECGEKEGIGEHTFGEWSTTKEATEDAEGSKARSCDTCGYEETASIPVLAHTHAFNTWATDTASHWKVCRCGNTTGKENHSYQDWITMPTTISQGYTTHICNTCGYRYVDSYVDPIVEKTGPLLQVADPNLQSALNMLIIKINATDNRLYVSDFENVSSIVLPWYNISDLSGIEQFSDFSAMNIFDFSCNQIKDVSPLADFKYLTELHLNNNQISDISPLKNLTNLKLLNLSINRFSDVTALANLTKLTNLDLGFNQITNVSPLANLGNLATLNLSSNQISDILPLSNLANLVDLNLSFNQIYDASALANLTKLTSLDLSFNQITDVSSLANLGNLKTLVLENNQISEFSTLSGLKNLTALYLGSNGGIDISTISAFTKLTELSLSGNHITDISSISGLTNLTKLYLSENQITDLSPLANLKNLKLLNLWDNQITDISALAALSNLTELELSLNDISDLSAIANLKNLKVLKLQSCSQISDITPLAALTNLEELWLNGCSVSDLTPLANLENLNLIYLTDCPVTDLSPVDHVRDVIK